MSLDMDCCCCAMHLHVPIVHTFKEERESGEGWGEKTTLVVLRRKYPGRLLGRIMVQCNLSKKFHPKHNN